VIEQIYLYHLNRLLDRAESEGDGEAVAALRWAILNLEMTYGSSESAILQKPYHF